MKKKTLMIKIIFILMIMSIIGLSLYILFYKSVDKNEIGYVSRQYNEETRLSAYNSDTYIKTSELSEEDVKDDYQKNYQKTSLNDGSYLTKSAEWIDKENGEALITIKGAQFQELENTRALYVATMCYAHGLTEDILVENISILIKYYDYVDFIAINNTYEDGIVDTKTFTSDSTEDEIRTYISETRNAGITYPHYIYSIPVAIQKYLFGNIGDNYISKDNLINEPLAIYVSCDSLYIDGEGESSIWGIDYASERYFSFMNEVFGERYFSMSQTSQQDDNPYLTIRYSNLCSYDSILMNALIGILNIENYDKTNLVLSEESLNEWENSTTEQLNLPYEDSKYAAKYSYDKNFEKAGVKIITNCSIIDVVLDYYEIVNVEATSSSDTLQTIVDGQKVTIEDANYVCGDEILIKIYVKLKSDVIANFEGFTDTNVGNATLSCNLNELSVESPKLVPVTSSYVVNYLEKDTNVKINEIKIEKNVPINTKVDSFDEIINIDGYNYDSVDKNSITISDNEIENVINIYYTKRTDLSYIVNYLEKGTNMILNSSKIVTGKTFNMNIKSSDEVIDIEGYNYDSCEKENIVIGTGENIINLYYTKRKDLSYVVNYYEQGTNQKIASSKKVDKKTFKEIVTEQAIDIVGYNKAEPTEKSIEINVENNVINFYYTKREDLSYIVKYLEKDTIVELATTKIVSNRTYQETVTELAIEIEGYDKVDPIEKSIQIEVSGNEIIFYYTKRTDLSYTVKYLEEDTNIELATIKTVSNQTFKSTVTEQAIEINGYDKVDPIEKSIQIEVSGNEIIFYYTKRVDLSYKVNYLLKDNDEDNSNNKILHEQKIVNNQRFKDEIIASDEVIFIYGYKLDSIDKETLVIETTENVINIFYVVDEDQTKELSYIVEYYINDEKQEDDTVVVSQSVQVLQPDTLPMKEELIDNNRYTGYEIDTTKEIPEIVNNGGIVEIHYKNRRFGYKIKYYFNGYVDEALTEEKSAKYLDVIDTYEEKIKEGYKFDTVENLPLTVTEKEENNVIKVYYKTDQTVIKEVKYVIFYYIDGVLVDTRTVTRKVQVLLPDKVAVDKTLVETDRYEDANFIKTEPAEVPSYVESGEIISVYYETKTSQITAKYVDKVTGETITEETIEGKVGDTYSIEAKEIEGYTLIESPELTGTYTEEAQEKVFYYAKNAEVKVKYLEKDTENVLADEETITGYEGKEYETTSKEIENYELVETIGVPSGTMTAGTQEVIYYYAQKTKVIVNHIDVISNEILETEAIEGKVGDEYSTTSKDFEGYVLIDELPENSQGIMSKEEIIVNYYYKHVSEGVIVKHIDKISGEILYNEEIEGNEGDSYETSSKEFDSYALDETLLPENASGNMTKELIEVKYYYVRKAQVKVQYLDRNTNEEISEEIVIDGHEGDSYTTTPKEIEEYYLVESMLPTNAEGTMTKEKIIVTYYYAKKSAGVLEKHINEKTGEVIEEKLHEGLIGDDYKISSKEFENYDLDTTKLPENSQGKMTEELIEVDYYYIRKAQVKVEYIDELTNEVIEQNIITGHEGDTYKTTPKEIKNYILDEEKLPENAEGIMEITVNEDGTVTSEIVVKYYYKKISAGVLEKHIDIKTDDVLEEEFHSGNVGDTYKIDSKNYEEYDLIEKDEEGNSKLPENSEGTMKEEQIEVDYYYIRKSTVRVEYVDNETGKKISEDRIIEGHEDDEYKTEPKEIKNYTLNKDKLPENAEGTMKVVRSEYFVDEVKTETVVTYYYDKVKKQDENRDNNNDDNTSNTNSTTNSNSSNSGGTTIIITDSSSKSNTSSNNSNNATSSTTSSTSVSKTSNPSTGDIVPVVALGIIILVGVANIIQAIISKRKKK